MAAQVPFKKVKLTEEDIPGAKLPNNVISDNSVVHLRRYLVTHGVRIGQSVRKDDLVQLATKVKHENSPVNPAVDNGKWLAAKAIGVRRDVLDEALLNTNFDVFPVTGWKTFPSRNIPELYCYGSLYKHLIESSTIIAVDREEEAENVPVPFATAKPLRKGRKFFIGGHVKEMEDATSLHGHFCVKAKVQASMKNEQFNVIIKLDKVSGEVLDAECHCKASSMSRCSHICALLLAIEDYTIHHGYTPPSCTSKICEWNKGRKLKSSAPVYSRQYTNKLDPSRVINFKAVATPHDIQEEGCMLKYSGQLTHFRHAHSMWDMILDFRYTDYTISDERTKVLQDLRRQLQFTLKFGLEAPNCIIGTEEQVSSDVWRRLRSLLITASSCAKFLTKDVRNFSKKINDLMWKPKVELDNVYVNYGRDNEENGRRAYEDLTGNKVSKTGLWVNPMYPGLGASPDGIVKCETTTEIGLLEVKCCYVLKDHLPTDLEKLKKEQLSGFYLKKQGDHVRVNNNHAYFKQVQMQLGITNLTWCDFVVWTPHGLFVERIERDEEWWREAGGTLQDIHGTYMCPEYFEMRLPRGLPLIEVALVNGKNSSRL